MNFLYVAGVLVGIIGLYVVLTIELAFLIAEDDVYKRFLISWIFGLILFVLVSIIALNGAGVFDIVRSNEVVKEVEDR